MIQIAGPAYCVYTGAPAKESEPGKATLHRAMVAQLRSLKLGDLPQSFINSSVLLLSQLVKQRIRSVILNLAGPGGDGRDSKAHALRGVGLKRPV